MRAPNVWRAGAFALALLALSAGCSTTGTAVGELKDPSGKQQLVTLRWKSDAADPERGSISGTLPDGTHYAGRYFEVIQTAPADIYADAWVGWRPFWPGWRAGWYNGPMQEDWSGFVKIYTGHVIANLKPADDKNPLRCRFTVDDPRAGLDGGAHGECQLASGATIEHVVVTAS